MPLTELSSRATRGICTCSFLAALGMTTPLLAQREHPISSRIDIGPAGISTRPGSTFEVKLAVTIPSQPVVWHLYSITQAPGGPIATTITVGPSSTFRLAGTIKGTPPDIADDPNFNMMTETHTDSVVYR